jgi:F0F1-type ATP synthase membrane subunit b/b'
MLKELNETRTRTTTQYDEIDQGIREDYDSKLADALQQARLEHDEAIRQTHEELEELYATKVSQQFCN